VLKSRFVALKEAVPVGHIGSIFRNNFMKIVNVIINFFDYNMLEKKN
jgi:hypothetical protein